MILEKIFSKPFFIMIAPIGAALFNIQLALIFLSFLLLIDLYYGIKKSFKTKGIDFDPRKRIFYKTIKSKGLRSSWLKASQYGLGIVISTFFQVLFFPNFEISIFGGTFDIITFIIMIACSIEIYSIFENMNVIYEDNRISKVWSVINKNFLDIIKKKK